MRPLRINVKILVIILKKTNILLTFYKQPGGLNLSQTISQSILIHPIIAVSMAVKSLHTQKIFHRIYYFLVDIKSWAQIHFIAEFRKTEIQIHKGVSIKTRVPKVFLCQLQMSLNSPILLCNIPKIQKFHLSVRCRHRWFSTDHCEGIKKIHSNR